MAEALHAEPLTARRAGAALLSGASVPTVPRDPSQRRQVRRTVLILALIALGLYFGFIVYAVLHGHH